MEPVCEGDKQQSYVLCDKMDLRCKHMTTNHFSTTKYGYWIILTTVFYPSMENQKPQNPKTRGAGISYTKTPRHIRTGGRGKNTQMRAIFSACCTIYKHFTRRKLCIVTVNRTHVYVQLLCHKLYESRPGNFTTFENAL